ncbi:MAG: helix-turn-helix domain-containing protein [Thermoflexibacter sp.]|jgi:transposase-like protein|nr:helix-turn-helix domain-containing protein [Thermoflexibacter sp.]
MTKEEKKQMTLDLYEQGLSLGKIAEQVGVSKTTVHNWVHEDDEEENEEIDFDEYEPINISFGDERKGLSGTELITLEKTRLEGIKAINEQKFKLKESAFKLKELAKENEHKRELARIKALQEEKEKEAQRLKKENEAKEKAKLQKEFDFKRESLHEKIRKFAELYLDLDGEKRTVRQLKKNIVNLKNCLSELIAMGKQADLTLKEIKTLPHYGVISYMISDLENIIEDEEDTEIINWNTDDDDTEALEPFLEEVEELNFEFNPVEED